jgi:hypothetical protein
VSKSLSQIKRYLLPLAFMLVCVVSLNAATTFTYDGIKYTVLSETDKTCQTKAGSSSWVPGNSVSGDIVIPSTVKNGNTEYTVTEIGKYSFAGRSEITSISIPNTVTSIGDHALQGCSSLTEIVIPGSVTSIGEWAFYNCTGLTEIDIPDSVTSLGNEAFSRCSSLTTVELSNSLTSIADYAFYQCDALATVEIPSSVTSIGNYAFAGCSSLASITIPSSVTSIGGSAFSGCSALTEITVESETPPDVTLTTFTSVPSSATLYVPASAVEAYSNASYWKNFNIEEIPFTAGIADVMESNSLVAVEDGAVSVKCDGTVKVVALNGTTVYSGKGDARINLAPGVYLILMDNKVLKTLVK